MSDRKDIPGYEGLYEADKEGKIYSIARRGTKGGEPSYWISESGYLHAILSNVNTKYKRVSRLILETFVGPCPKGMECRHLNGKKLDNRLINLK